MPASAAHSRLLGNRRFPGALKHRYSIPKIQYIDKSVDISGSLEVHFYLARYCLQRPLAVGPPFEKAERAMPSEKQSPAKKPDASLAADSGASVTLTSTIEHKLRRDLASAVFLPGERLAIDDLRQRYGSGASPVREALNRLSAEGWVLQLDQRGFRVPPVSVSKLAELTRTRCLLNEVTLREAIGRANERTDEAIVVALHRLSRTPTRISEDSKQINPDWEERHRLFHASLIAACGSQWLIDFDAMLFEQAARYRALSARSKKSRDVHKEHKAIADAVIARNVGEAVRLLNAHINHTSELVSQVTRQHEVV
jgi:GntR family carbon starvation induced transcriptional regulator